MSSIPLHIWFMCGWLYGFYIAQDFTVWMQWINILARQCWWGHKKTETDSWTLGFTQHLFFSIYIYIYSIPRHRHLILNISLILSWGFFLLSGCFSHHFWKYYGLWDFRPPPGMCAQCGCANSQKPVTPYYPTTPLTVAFLHSTITACCKVTLFM